LVPKLVIAGKKGWLFDEIFATVKKCHIEEYVVFTDFVTEDQKWTLYQNAIASVLPSVYEGFGIPIIEAMKLMTPVICSDIPPLKEVAKDTVFYFNPSDKKELVKKLIDFQKIDSLKLKKITQLAKNRADFFTWDNSAKTLVALFKKFS
jgi:glycosyltransferase involved in cell wall biosynthesis